MNDELMQERFSLMRERISEIQKEELVKDPYRDFFRKTGDFILEICRIHDRIREGWLEKASMEELKENNHKMYEDILRSTMESLTEIRPMPGKSWAGTLDSSSVFFTQK